MAAEEGEGRGGEEEEEEPDEEERLKGILPRILPFLLLTVL